jgi:folate-binding protein YgfZ
MALTDPVLLDRAVFPISGPDAESFLQNLLTQDMARLAAAPAIYAGLLTPQGKVAFDFILWRAGEGYAVDINAARAGDLIRQLQLYRLRAKVEIGPIADGQGAWAGPQGAAADPRRPELGARWLAPGAPASAEPEAYRTHRIALGVPDLAHDGREAESFALEALFEELNGVDFQKGCFVGQENVSRMKRRATTRRKYCPVTFDGAPPAFDAPITAGPAEIGAVRTAIAGRALALLRLDRAHEAAEKGDALVADGKTLQLDPPPWLIAPG